MEKGLGSRPGEQGRTVVAYVCEAGGADDGKSRSDCVACVKDELPLLYGERRGGFENSGHESVRHGCILACGWYG